MNGEKIHCIGFVDDIALVSESGKDMYNFLTALTKILQKYQTQINTNKTKIMAVAKEINNN